MKTEEHKNEWKGKMANDMDIGKGKELRPLTQLLCLLVYFHR